MSWAERAADRSPVVRRSRARSMQQAKVIVDAAHRLISVKGNAFTTQELVKEAGVALQTFYRYFASKDQLLLAVLEDLIAEGARQVEERTRDLTDPVARLRLYVTSSLSSLETMRGEASGAQFVTSEHWRLQQLFPAEVDQASQPFTDLVLRELRAAEQAGRLKPTNAEQDAWLVTRLVTSVYHHYAFAPPDEPVERVGEQVWEFCLGALGGTADRP